jgi:hypothetical protein
MPSFNLGAFEAGRTAGQARSPVTGLGEAIRGILDTARKGGLLQVQSQAQAAGSNLVNILKEGRAEERAVKPKETIIVGETKEQDRTITAPGTTDIKLGRAPDPLAQAFANIIDPETGGFNVGGTVQDVETRARAFLRSQKLPETERNLKVAIEKIQSGEIE